MKSTFRTSLAAATFVLAPLGAALVAQPAAAQTYTYRVAQVEQGRIGNVSISSDAGLRPGATVRVRVHATPDARWANVALGGVRVPLHERARGEYVGTHVIRRGEHIDPTGRITVHAGWGAGPVALAFSYPPSFQALAMGAGPAVIAPVVESFVMTPAHDLRPGSELHIRLEGTPHARASVNVPGVARLPLREVRPGVYVGRYTVRRDDDRHAFRDAVAVLRRGDERTVAHLSRAESYGYGYGRDDDRRWDDR